jgi:hypothetical protein
MLSMWFLLMWCLIRFIGVFSFLFSLSVFTKEETFIAGQFYYRIYHSVLAKEDLKWAKLSMTKKLGRMERTDRNITFVWTGKLRSFECCLLPPSVNDQQWAPALTLCMTSALTCSSPVKVFSRTVWSILLLHNNHMWINEFGCWLRSTTWYMHVLIAETMVLPYDNAYL